MRRMNIAPRSLFLLFPFVLAAAACGGAPPPAEDDVAAETSDALRACPSQSKIAFTRKTGCQNDGSVEFCVPKSDLRLQRRITTIAPKVTLPERTSRTYCIGEYQLIGVDAIA